jgi:hypothetical protein
VGVTPWRFKSSHPHSQTKPFTGRLWDETTTKHIVPAVETDEACPISASIKLRREWAVSGFKRAAARYRSADTADADAVSHTLTEVVMWIDILVGQFPDIDGDPIIKAMGFARARSHHHLASLILLPEGATQWQWRRASLLPLPSEPKYSNSRGERAYRSVLEGKPVGETLAAAERAVDNLQGRLAHAAAAS